MSAKSFWEGSHKRQGRIDTFGGKPSRELVCYAANLTPAPALWISGAEKDGRSCT
jgi:hypothetical protein